MVSCSAALYVKIKDGLYLVDSMHDIVYYIKASLYVTDSIHDEAYYIKAGLYVTDSVHDIVYYIKAGLYVTDSIIFMTKRTTSRLVYMSQTQCMT